MEKGEEHSSSLTPSSSNPPSVDIPKTAPNLSNYMHSWHGPVPAWSPAFMPYPDGNQYPSNIQYGIGPPIPLITTSSTTSSRVRIEDTPDCKEIEAPCTSSKVDEESKEDGPDSREIENGSAGTPGCVQMDDGDMIEEPKSGMEFNSFEELMSYYKQYAKKCGFEVMTKRSERGEDETVRYVTLACARGGKARNRTLNVTKPRPTGKTECKAKINALKVEGKVRLTTVHNIHNHNLSLQKSRFFRCNRESVTVKRVVDTNDLAGIQLNLPCLENNCCNYIDNARHLRLGKGGAVALREYFLRMQYKNSGFFALMDLDDDGRLKNVFWADSRSRAAYQYFGDVVTFDTTYLTNRYEMPFVPFVGINHHGQSILLGVGLISSEDTETFVWLFQTWLQCMDGIAPKAIITDHDMAIKNAIAIVFPESRHRFCLWHILKKVPEKLGSHGSYKSGLKNALMKCVYDTQSVEEFEKCWDELITTYNLHENAWLQSLFAEREYWVPAFLKEFFWAGMSTTQRSESINTFFNGYVSLNLKEFVNQFDNALKMKIENENSADFHSFNVAIPCISRSPIEKRFQDLYTNAKFKEVQQQLTGIIDMDPTLLKKDGAVKTYLVEDEVRGEEFTKLVTHSVDFNEEDTAAKCSCRLFQMRGILCRHILAVFKCNRIKSLPDRYILDRWRKDIKRRYTFIYSSYDLGDQRADANRYSSLLNICYQMITHAAGSKEHTEDATNKLYAMIDLYRNNQESPSMTLTGSNIGCTTKDTTTAGSSKQVFSPHVVRRKGKLPSLRRASRMEKDVRKVKVKTKKVPVKGKRKQRDGEDTPVVDACKNLCGPSEIDISNIGGLQVPDNSAFDISGTQPQETMIVSQESMQFGLDGSQPVQLDLDGSQPAQ
ncbi:protein FAR1-RELATED SEQUENCE 5-like isoform X2 [Juglans microcarpa x Juglans regia]|uniref:protein FAR1-RELATED SEQUENCE 5-like isoform X2 n=1 Tax=Juglans microcarpa x Juglans regia TaxID=2249226 RepID=UPI001B7F2016|nr:protein FAR1-RELATED SEQUENCE 5-like isoform X2 [Juglans microcarpa x Juglans regia]